jgi:hypothetical protein
MDRRDRIAVSALAALVALVVYLPRLAPTLTLLGDSAVFVSAAAMWGVPQPSGYPLWTALGALFARVPLGELPYRLHLMSALCHIATVFVVAYTIAVLTRSRVAALSGALCLAFSRAFFLGSLYAEVFPLNDLFTAVALFLGLDLHRRGVEEQDLERPLMRLALVCGLASAHHQTIALLAPSLALLVWKSGALPLLRGNRLLKLFAIFVAPIVAFYALLVVAARRQPFSSWGDVHDLDSLLHLMTRQDYGGLTSPHRGAKELEASILVNGWFESTVLAFGWSVLLVAVIGAWSAIRDKRGTGSRIAGVALVLAVLVSGPVFAVMNQIDVDTEHGRAFAERFSTMAAVPLALLIGFGVAALLSGLKDYFPAGALRVALGMLFVFPLSKHAAACDLRDDRRGIQVAHDLVREVPDGSLVLITGDALNGAALYVCGVERRCGRTLVFSPGQMHLGWRVEQLRRWYPDLVLPTPAGKFITVRELVSANLDRRQIYVSTQILDLEPALRDAFNFLPDGIHVRALREVDVEPFKATFADRARRFARGDNCEGCGMARSDLQAPSLETSLPFLYALAFENHARVLSAFNLEPNLAALFELRAEQVDPESIKKLRSPGPPAN